MALSAPATNASGATVVIAPTATSVTTTILDNDTQTFSLTQASTTVNEGSADSYTVHLSNPIDPGVTVSATIAITLPAGSAAPRRRISPMPSWPTLIARSQRPPGSPAPATR